MPGSDAQAPASMQEWSEPAEAVAWLMELMRKTDPNNKTISNNIK